MVKIERGKTIFDSNAQTLVNTINCVGVMGKGLALEFKNKYPEMFDKYKSFCDKGVFKPGVLWIYKAPDGKWILNFPTKVDWRDDSKMEYIWLGLQKFIEIWKEKGITSVAFPLLGCKNGGLDPNNVIPVMQQFLDQCEGLDVTIYDDREPEQEVPETDATSEFFGDESPKEVVVESKPLVEDEPPVMVETEEPVPAVTSEEPIPEADENPKGKDVFVEEHPDTQETYTTDEILQELINERKAIHNEVDKVLNEFAGQQNTPEVRKAVTKKIVNVINRRGFPADSFFQI